MSDTVEKLIMKKAALKEIPIKGSLELTPLCNMNCKMCYIKHTPEEVKKSGGIKPVEFWTDMIPEMKEAGVLFLGLIGGEALVYPDFPNLYNTFYKNGFYLNITTNGTLLANGIPGWMKKSPPRYVTVSLYGASNETYENVTGKKDVFYLVKKAIYNLLQEGIPTKLNYCVVPENKEDLECIYEMSREWNIPIMVTPYSFPAIRRELVEQYKRCSPEEVASVYHQIKKRELGENYEAWCYYLSQKKYNQKTDRHTDKMYCTAGINNFWINWKGVMTSCGMLETPKINLTKHSFKEAWMQINQKTKNLITSSKCACCQYREICLVCPAMMKAETGEFQGTSEYHCKMTHSIIKQAIQIASGNTLV